MMTYEENEKMNDNKYKEQGLKNSYWLDKMNSSKYKLEDHERNIIDNVEFTDGEFSIYDVVDKTGMTFGDSHNAMKSLESKGIIEEILYNNTFRYTFGLSILRTVDKIKARKKEVGHFELVY